MSAEATGWVFRHSPLRGAAFSVHLAIADSVNDQYGNEFWMAAGGLADKSRCDRATVFRTIDKLVEGGYLYVLEAGGGRRKPTRYRFLFPDTPALFESRRKPSHDATRRLETVADSDSSEPKPSHDATNTVAQCDTEPKGSQAARSQGSDERVPQDPLTLRLVRVCSGSRVKVWTEAPEVLALLREHYADHVIDQGIGVCELLETPPVLPRYLLKVVQENDTGQFVPDLYEQFKGDAA